jgi:hypothetical protein
MDERARRYLYQEHSPQELREWANRLTLFRFCRAFGGHAGDGDSLRLHLRVRSREDALGIVAALGAEPRPHPSNPELVGTEGQPGWSTIAGTSVFIWIQAERLEFAVQDLDDLWAVTESAVAAAERIESRFGPFDARRIDPPVDSWHCIAPATHPELFE